MNGSGANVAGCATCGGRCCRQYRVEVTVADVRRLAAGTALNPAEFIKLIEREKDKHGFRLRPGGPPNELHLFRRPTTRACVFLMEIAPDQARCGVYAHRPLVCRNFPATLRRGSVSIREDVKCGPDSWNLAAMELTTYRRDLTKSSAAWDEHWKVVDAWNDHVDAEWRRASPSDLYDFVLSYSPGDESL